MSEDAEDVVHFVTATFAENTILCEVQMSDNPARIPVIDPLNGKAELHIPAGATVTLLYSSYFKAYIPYPRELME